jgi:hypothetical protein
VLRNFRKARAGQNSVFVIPFGIMKHSSRTIFFVVVLTLFQAQTYPALCAKSKATAAASSVPTDPGWPREIERDGIRFVYYQPQVDEWKNFQDLRARIAFTLTGKDGKPAVGIEELRGRTVANVENRTVLIDNIEITAVRFPSLSDLDAAAMEKLLRSTFPGKPITVSLDRLIASVQISQENAKTVPVKTDPPKILVSTTPAILLTVQGDPVLAPIKSLNLKFVLNANWDLFYDPEASRYYLLADKLWLTNKSLDGVWSATKSLPPDFRKFPSDGGWDHVKKALPPSGSSKAPKVFFTAEPAELIVFAGEPVYKKIEGTELQYATNTDDWVFTDSADGQIYYLVTGRWFRAPNLDGPWIYAGDDLPDDFRHIPTTSGAAEVLASVPGTSESEDAILLAQVPTTAVVKRAEAESKVKVTYYGVPQFLPIEGTSLRYATNASADVIQVDEKYYLCANGVWFVATSPTGPWKICTSVPKAIYTIPPSSPVYHVTYVKVEGSNEQEVTCSYSAGYYGAYVAGVAKGATLVWGTGYYYPPYVYSAAVPIYRPYYATYGVAAAYYPYNGVYAVGGYSYGPYASAGSAAWYNPSTGGYGRAYTQQSPYGGRTSAWGYNPSTDTAWNTQQGHGYYAQWGTSTVTRGDQTIQTGHVATNYGSTVVAQGQNNLYAGHDGNAYKRDDNGDWSKWDNGQWTPVTPPSGNNGSKGQNNLSSQNQQTDRKNSGAQPKASPGAGGQKRGSAQTGDKPENNRVTQSTKPANESQKGEPKTSTDLKGTGSERSKQTSDNPTSGLDREASARQRGSASAKNRQKSEAKTSRSSRSTNDRASKSTRERGRVRD